MSVNTSETILQINETNIKKASLGGDERTIVTQKLNGVELLRDSPVKYFDSVEGFDRFYPESYVDEMKEYKSASMDNSKNAIVKKYDDESHVINQPVKVEPDSKITQTAPKYESMYNDSVCRFFIGSVSLISLYVVFQILEGK